MPIAAAALATLQQNAPPRNPPRNFIQNDDDDDIFSNLEYNEHSANATTNNHPIQVEQINSTHSTPSNRDQPTNLNHWDDDDDDIFFEANIPDTTVPEATPNDPFDDDDFDPAEIEATIQMEMQNQHQGNAPNDNAKASCSKSAVPTTSNDDYFDSDFDDIFTDDYAPNSGSATVSDVITDRDYEFKVAGMPLVTILQLHSVDDSEKCGHSFVAKCEVLKTVQSIRIVSNRFHLVVLLQDSTGMQLEVSACRSEIAFENASFVKMRDVFRVVA